MERPSTTAPRMEYPFAPSPDILRTHQKDAYITGELSVQASSILRALLGARFAHKYSNATNHLTELLYLCITTLLGNRTLGEEYCDVVQVESDTLRLASLGRRLGYIVSVVFAPWILSKSIPALRRKLRLKLELNIARAHARAKQRGAKVVQHARSIKVQEYILKHLDSLTSLSPIYAVSLAIFYFTGAYYHLSKRLFGLRYIFTKALPPSEKREGYEVLGVLLVLQMTVQSILHVREIFFNGLSSNATLLSAAASIQPVHATVGPGIEIPLQSRLHSSSLSSSDEYLSSANNTSTQPLPPGVAANTNTPILDSSSPRYDLNDPEVQQWIPAGQQRKCTLCLEPLRDPSATSCGHVFCWMCVQDWVREKPECPLCRQDVLPQKILPLR